MSALGAVYPVLACLPAAETVAPCPAGTAPGVVESFQIAATARQQFEAAFAPVDFAQAGEFWAIAFVTLLCLWSLAQMFGYTKRAIR